MLKGLSKNSFPWIANHGYVLLNDFRKPSLGIKLKTFANHKVKKYIVAYCFNRALFLVSIHDHPWTISKMVTDQSERAHYFNPKVINGTAL